MARVLVADDHAHLRTVVAICLEREGHEVIRVPDGTAALARLQAERFDVLVTDVDMPNMDGLTLLRHHDAIEKLRGVIVLTSREDYRELGDLYAEERLKFLPKPFGPLKLSQLISEFLTQTPACRS